MPLPLTLPLVYSAASYSATASLSLLPSLWRCLLLAIATTLYRVAVSSMSLLTESCFGHRDPRNADTVLTDSGQYMSVPRDDDELIRSIDHPDLPTELQDDKGTPDKVNH